MSSPHHHQHLPDQATKNITVAFFLNLVFAIIELIGGFLTNSIAILSDALHDFGDSVALGISWYLEKVSKRGRDRFYSYGYRRFSLLGAVFISVILIIGSVFVIRESALRFFSPEETNAKGMFLLALLGVGVNGYAVYKLRKGSSFNERAVSLHLFEDVLGWVAVLLVSVVMMFVHLPFLDPALSVLISFWVLFNVYRNLKNTFKVLLQEVPQDVELDSLITNILKIDGVISFHDLHLWTLDGENHIMTIHIVTDTPGTEHQQRIKKEIRHLCRHFGIGHATIEIDAPDEKCGLDGC